MILFVSYDDFDDVCICRSNSYWIGSPQGPLYQYTINIQDEDKGIVGMVRTDMDFNMSGELRKFIYPNLMWKTSGTVLTNTLPLSSILLQLTMFIYTFLQISDQQGKNLDVDLDLITDNYAAHLNLSHGQSTSFAFSGTQSITPSLILGGVVCYF